VSPIPKGTQADDTESPSVPASLKQHPKDGAARLRLERDAEFIEIGLGWVHGTYEEVFPRAAPLLSPSEAKLLTNLEFPRRRESYLLGRYAAKRGLLLLLNEPDGSRISVFSGAFDQPLVEYPSQRGVSITITHTQGLALGLAFPVGHPMGIDVERKDASRLAILVAQMTSAERAWAETSGLEEVTCATMLWTMKEALAKALTTGLMSPWEIYATGEWRCIGEGIWESRFLNFAQYRAVTWMADDAILSLALPRNSLLSPDALQVVATALRG